MMQMPRRMLLNFAAVKRFSYAGAELHTDKGHVKNAGKKAVPSDKKN